MSMAYYEPGSGWSLPPGCFDGDPNAPWNQVDEPACGDCAHCIEGCCDYGICELEAAISNEELAGATMADVANKAVDWALDHMRDGGEIACERFRP